MGKTKDSRTGPPTGNIERLMKMAQGLGGLLDTVVFVGGSVVELYVDDPGAAEVRPTLDVDCVIQPEAAGNQQSFEAELEKLGFRHDLSEDSHLWRWTFHGIQVDIIPVTGPSKGMENRWYAEGVRNLIQRRLFDGFMINLLALPYFFATKLEATKGRGWDDLRLSHDFEDIVFLLDSCSSLMTEILGANKGLQKYLSATAKELLARTDIGEAIEAAIPRGSEDRVKLIRELLVAMSDCLAVQNQKAP